MTISLTRPSQVRALLRELEFRPRKVLGQNFLIDGNIRRILLSAARLSRDDQVLEIGPGLGVVTEALLQHAKRVVAVEIDSRLHAWLAGRFRDEPRLELHHADVLKMNLAQLWSTGLTRVVANLPYAVGTRVLLELVELKEPPARMAVTLQLDVADRLTAAPDTKAYGAISILAQSRYSVSKEKVISPTCFYPAPKVRSAIVTLQHSDPELAAPAVRPRLRALLKHVFSQRRKKLATSLRSASRELRGGHGALEAAFRASEIDPGARPESIGVASWCQFATALDEDSIAARRR